jgi:uncharacterized protein YigE (DUF2233 family)
VIRPATLLLALWAAPVMAADCGPVVFEGQDYTVCQVTPGVDDLRIFLNDSSGVPYGEFAAVERAHGPLVFAMNAGMYHPDRRPVGAYVEDGLAARPVVTGGSDSNFGMLPNGILCISDDQVQVIETLAYVAAPPACRFATQSGPMLLIDGVPHPRFLPDSTFRNIRNGVGVSADGKTVTFAISDEEVTFMEFARLFRDRLGADQALYLDGSISRLYAPALGRDDWGPAMGPIVGVLAP